MNGHQQHHRHHHHPGQPQAPPPPPPPPPPGVPVVPIPIMDLVVQAQRETSDALREALATKNVALMAMEATIRTKDELIEAKDEVAFYREKYKELLTEQLHELKEQQQQHQRGGTKRSRSPSTTIDETDTTTDDESSSSGFANKKPRIEKTSLSAPRTFTFSPHEALAAVDVLTKTFSFLGLPDLASASSVCSHWKHGSRNLSKDNDYWRIIARSRWPAWAESFEQAMGGTKYDYRDAVRDQLKEQADAIKKFWSTYRSSGNHRLLEEQETLEEDRPADVPMICLLAHRNRIEGSPIVLSALSHESDIPPPVFQRYENAVLALYEEEGGYDGGVVELPSIPVNVSYSLRTSHEEARSLVKKIYLTEECKLLPERPRFRYSDDNALFLAMSNEDRSPVQIHNGLVRAQSLGL